MKLSCNTVVIYLHDTFNSMHCKGVMTSCQILWSAIGVKIVFNSSALCDEYISQHIYKYVHVYIKYVDVLQILQCIYMYIDIFINTATYLYIQRRIYKYFIE